MFDVARFYVQQKAFLLGQEIWRYLKNRFSGASRGYLEFDVNLRQDQSAYDGEM